MAYRPGDGNHVGLFFCPLPPTPTTPHYHLFFCVIGSAGHFFLKERLCGNGTVGAAKPTNQPGTPHGDGLLPLPPPPFDCKQHGDQLHLGGAIIDFALSYLWLLWVHVQHTTVKKKNLNCKGCFIRNLPLEFLNPEVICFVSWAGRKLRFRPSLFSQSELKVKKRPMRASLFSIRPPFWTTGSSLSCSWKQKKRRFGLNFASSLFLPSTTEPQIKPSSQRPLM